MVVVLSKMEVRTEGLIQPVVQPLQTKSDIFAFFFFASSHVSPSRSPAPLLSLLPSALFSVLRHGGADNEWSARSKAVSYT